MMALKARMKMRNIPGEGELDAPVGSLVVMALEVVRVSSAALASP
jgi:hypothetical protein